MNNDELVGIVANSIKELDTRINNIDKTVVKAFSYLYNEDTSQKNLYNEMSTATTKQSNNITIINNSLSKIHTELNLLHNEIKTIKKENAVITAKIEKLNNITDSLSVNLSNNNYNYIDNSKSSIWTCIGKFFYVLFNYSKIKKQKKLQEELNIKLKEEEEQKKIQEYKLIEEQKIKDKQKLINTINNILRQ